MTGGFSVLQAFTLGEDDATWRDVAVPGGASCCTRAGIVSIGGAAYWVTEAVERVVCFDLKSERVAFDAPLPVGPGRGYEFHLTGGPRREAGPRRPCREDVGEDRGVQTLIFKTVHLSADCCRVPAGVGEECVAVFSGGGDVGPALLPIVNRVCGLIASIS
ncbi:hypothetical protein HU200_010733 [Digitaria exilis]|uniref:Uncharacterized protein n=1 Tax=Digitaria exilis TaxID=1010633 RepID=A0A835FJ45_9POAL|nr:hypothetical protein HU200_010733 [Digitaria exilis]